MKLSSAALLLLYFSDAVLGFQQSNVHNRVSNTRTIESRTHKGSSDTALKGAINPILSSIQAVESPLGSIAVLASIVLVHEAGHFLAAKNYGMKINEFSIGFGPKLLGFKGFKEKDCESDEETGIDFSLRLLPLGGYVAFPENYNRTLAFQMETEYLEKLNEYNKVNGKESFLSRIVTKLKREDEEQQLALKVEAERRNRKWWNIFYREKVMTAKPFDPNERVTIDYYDDPDYLQNRPWFQKAVVLSGGVIFNFILAFTLFFGSATIGPGIPKPVFEAGAVITTPPKATSPSYGLLERGDIIVGINGEKISIHFKFLLSLTT